MGRGISGRGRGCSGCRVTSVRAGGELGGSCSGPVRASACERVRVLRAEAGPPAVQHRTLRRVAGVEPGAGGEAAVTVPPPRIGTPRDPSRPTLGAIWADMMLELGFEPHVWQQLRADVQYELVPCVGERLAAGVTRTIAGRQDREDDGGPAPTWRCAHGAVVAAELAMSRAPGRSAARRVHRAGPHRRPGGGMNMST